MLSKPLTNFIHLSLKTALIADGKCHKSFNALVEEFQTLKDKRIAEGEAELNGTNRICSCNNGTIVKCAELIELARSALEKEKEDWEMAGRAL